MKKRLLTTMMAVVLLITSVNGVVFAENDSISVYLNGKQISFDTPPQIINNRTMVPVRAIFEALGASVNWDETTHTIISAKNMTDVILTIDSNTMFVNGSSITLDSPACIVDGRTFVPVRAISEAYNTTVEWSEKNKSVIICSEDVFAYKDYPDVPDLGKCYNIPVVNEKNIDGYKVYSYIYSDMSNDEYYSYLYDNSAFMLGEYSEEATNYENGTLDIKYTKKGEYTPRYYIYASYDENDSMLFDVCISDSTISNDNISDYVNNEELITLYALDGRTIDVLESEVPAYLNVGWYKTIEETQQTLYAPDGRTITVFQAEVPAYLNVGWYETSSDAYESIKPAIDVNNDSNKYEGVYRTPSGKRYHFNKNCGGKNSYEITMEEALNAGLTPCAKCVGV